MKIKLLPDAPTEHRCDVCQRMFPAGTLVDDRGRFVCQKCYDTMNPPEELASPSSELSVASNEEALARIEARNAFWRSPTGAGIHLAGLRFLIVLFFMTIYIGLVIQDYMVVLKSVVWMIIIVGLRLRKLRVKEPSVTSAEPPL